ncbi:isoaspartyl peptidase/L-asparaginase [Subsaximicrobium wynnwilliamsii]|uniref:Isoaspartyl peptidase n=1 Tax=Subsaximicrobium wynnwilliamsii TaxID=291179 RepID=A0A5C6ZBR7_9FLAO|nr:isoaspartyl peptidase/L-asparaginase [Subsaximicrobium wynnwilliamsii]TXD81459.1 isoaspartyl peptidase/L-asparaginase [Subsaximicrobium wynnwilliamsii]TXD87063.1 isoaspartyl peptidase/L-asparaginase [Subsaximicrobium wynnwilliamsii]TXE00814.1 isoaspartyl peptidase/L-asparaginase [Subsaximicrobium wynnwilliamsii]
MRNPIFFLALFSLCLSCGEMDSNANTTAKASDDKPSEVTQKAEFAIIIHGGAGNILKKNMTSEDEAAYKAKLEEAIRVGYEILKNGGSSLDAVQKTINVMEDSPLFNAGKGAVFTNAETNELDASIMDGKTLNAGASAGTTTVRNPINLARAIMDNSPHVMMAGTGAETFAKEQGLDIVSPSYFYTENRFKSLQRIKASEKTEGDHDNNQAFYDPTIKDSKFGTVGCAALDKDGNLAAGTSTGGMTNKRYGRVGDAPIIGAGTYANNNSCAVSSTGWGEYFIRAMVAHDISALMQYKGMSLAEAAREVIQKKVPDLGGDGGIIAVDKNGAMVAEFNTAGMYRATMNDKGELEIGIYGE